MLSIEFKFANTFKNAPELIDLVAEFRAKDFTSVGNKYYYLTIHKKGCDLMISKLTQRGFKVTSVDKPANSGHNPLMFVDRFLEIEL